MRALAGLTTNGTGFSGEMVPISDQAIGATWSEDNGDADGDVFDETNEGRAAYDDSTTNWQEIGDGVAGTLLKQRMTAINTPSDPTKMDLQVRIRALVGDLASVILSVHQPQGTLISADSFTLTTAAGWTTRQFQATSQFDLSAITDWTDVYISLIYATATSGRKLLYSAASMQQG